MHKPDNRRNAAISRFFSHGNILPTQQYSSHKATFSLHSNISPLSNILPYTATSPHTATFSPHSDILPHSNILPAQQKTGESNLLLLAGFIACSDSCSTVQRSFPLLSILTHLPHCPSFLSPSDPAYCIPGKKGALSSPTNGHSPRPHHREPPNRYGQSSKSP